MTSDARGSRVATPVIFVLGAGAPEEVRERRWWTGFGWPVRTLVGAAVLLTTGGGVALTTAQAAPPAAVAVATADVPQLSPGVVRIETGKWTQVSRGGPKQLLVTYRSRRTGARGTAVLARSGGGKHWRSVYTGTHLTSDVLAPTGSALAGDVALSLIAAVDRLSHGAYAIPASPANVALLEVWMAHEGGLWADNPLNTSLDASRYPHQFTTGGQNTGIPIYPNLTTGVTETALTLLGNPAYTAILRVLDGGSGSCVAFGTAVVESPWASSHYGHDAGSFCPTGPAPVLTVHTPIAPRGSHEPGTATPHTQSTTRQRSRPSAVVRTGQGSSTTAVSGRPIISVGG